MCKKIRKKIMNTYIDIVEKIICGIILFISAVSDIRDRRINIIPPVIMSVTAIILRIIQNQGNGFRVLLAVVPGVIMLLVSHIFREMAGGGDGIIMCYVGVSCGLYRSLIIFTVSFVFIWIYCIARVISGKKISKKTAIPYIPYVFAAWFFVIIYTGITRWL